MTANQNAARANAIAEDRAKEDARKNRAAERQKDQDRAQDWAKHSAEMQEKARKRGADERVGWATAVGKTIGSILPKLGKNDPDWYTPTDQQLRDVASFSFNTPLGVAYPQVATIGTNAILYNPDGTEKIIPVSGNNANYAVDGIATLELVTVLGQSRVPGDTGNGVAVPAIEAASQAVYSFVRHANSGSKNYDPVDMMLYMISISEVYAMIMDGVRAYSLARSYSSKNYYYQSLLKALKWNPDDVRNNMAKLRSAINARVAIINQWAIPVSLPFFKRRMFLYANVYKELKPTGKEELYAFVPESYAKFTTSAKVGDEGAGAIVRIANPYDKTVDAYIAKLDDAISAIYKLEDVGIMSGDILKAYGDRAIHKLGELADDAKLEPIYDAYVLSQFRNATVVQHTSEHNGTIYQEGGNLKCDFEVQLQTITEDGVAKELYFVDGLKPIIRMEDDTSPEAIMEATRLVTTISPTYRVEDGQAYHLIDSCGSEIATYARTWAITNQDPDNLTVFTYDMFISSTEQAQPVFNNWRRRGQFSHVPYMYNIINFGSSIAAIPIVDYENYRMFTYPEIKRLHECALQGLFNLPSLAFAK